MAFYKSTAVVTSIERNSDGKWVMFAQSEKDGRLNLSEKANKINSFPYEICHIGDIVEYGHWNDGSVAPISNITYNSNKKIRNFINQEKQDAVVTSVIYRHNINSPKAEIRAYSPVWKEIYYESYGFGQTEVQRGDIVTFSRTKNNKDIYEYHLHENKTAEDIKIKGIVKILEDFNEVERGKILLLADQIRLGLVK